LVSSLRVVTVASNKGGVGKTTIATNLAVYLRALREDLPILVLGLDDQDVIQRMFALDASAPAEADVLEALRARALAPAIRLGQYGVHYVPPSPTLDNHAYAAADPLLLRRLLVESGWQGLVVIDTKSDLGALTQSALAACDLALVVVSDQTSLDQAERIYALFDGFGKSRARARIVLSLVDRRVKYRGGEDADILALLLAEIRRRAHPCFETFLSRSPKIESLYTNGERRAHSILHGAPGSLVHRQMAHLASDVLRLLDAEGAAPSAERRRELRRPFVRRIAGFGCEDPPVLALRGRDLSAGGIALEPCADLARTQRLHLALAPEDGADHLLVWAEVLRREPDHVALRFEVGADAALRGRLARFVETLA
jgi:cellulose biosynthesis protein BcsQ